ncbi:MAG: bifunctional diaminohydroxyphosphoribosylaminopyrimidine deaminase/5-amino-6-(5-phosphoribosylamino)uracil reductase RibD [Bdellovibrionaceae bacterium]|nr:bifunctional diaminohydroxyphosphoribosylaminopyrimidine deaminase/5-amino-6-(5-phosphoribosylamino)uracil reductase RibD [Bdellovibrionales bacterium]MCB9086312.1 bifunctional diaminohydroxyphosphoribosylaminopyrimidine deaminase/5-amino-6-(5-phosphoribosylamino)uracil reductase RibD [Pseudobdellovibrionaceae bacterium]
MEYRPGDILDDQQAMSLALDEGKKGLGRVSPNPPVGCVIVDKDHRLISAGHHQRCGGPHAEIEALNQVDDPNRLEGAQVFVTLEPCSHHGKTPPCADKLASLPLARVVYGLQDPNPKVAGRGAERLSRAGIKTQVWSGSLGDELAELIEVFRCNMEKGRPFFALKVATTLDGNLAEKSGKSRWITGEESRQHVHILRSYYDSVLVGCNTVIVDDPRLNIRLGDDVRKNKVVILDPQNKLGFQMRTYELFKCRGPVDVFQIVSPGYEGGADTDWNQLSLPLGPTGHFDSLALAHSLFKAGINSVFVEGGADTFSQLVGSGIVDRLYLFMAPKLLGGINGKGWLNGFASQGLDTCPKMSSHRVTTFGEDFLIEGLLQIADEGMA